MGLFDDIKSAQEQNNKIEAQKKELELDFEKQIISDELASLMAEGIAQSIINAIKDVVPNKKKDYIHKWKSGILIDKYRYQISLDGKFGGFSCSKMSKGNLNYYNSKNSFPNIFPNDNGFIYFWGKFFYRNIASLRKVFNLARIRLLKDSINCVYEISNNTNEDASLTFYAVIPCDKDGNI